jgi:hypothetical protein
MTHSDTTFMDAQADVRRAGAQQGTKRLRPRASVVIPSSLALLLGAGYLFCGQSAAYGAPPVVLNSAFYAAPRAPAANPPESNQYDAARPFRARDALVVTATTYLTITIAGSSDTIAALTRVGGLHVLARTADAPPSRWYTVQRLLPAVTRIRLLPGQYRIGPPAEYVSGGSSDLTAVVTWDSPAVTLVAHDKVDPKQEDTLSEQIPEVMILTNAISMQRQLTNLRREPSDYVNFYAPLGVKVSLSFCSLSRPPREFAAALPRAAREMEELRKLGVPVFPMSGMLLSDNYYAQWFDRAMWERAAANFKLAVETFGVQEYGLDFEPYWNDPPRYPKPDEDTTRCKAAMQPLIDAIRKSGVRVYNMPGKGYAPCDAVGEAWPQTTYCSEFGFPLPGMPEPVWTTVDADLEKAATGGRSALAGFYSEILRTPTPKFLIGLRARGINRYWVFPGGGPGAERHFVDTFFTRAWFDK